MLGYLSRSLESVSSDSCGSRFVEITVQSNLVMELNVRAFGISEVLQLDIFHHVPLPQPFTSRQRRQRRTARMRTAAAPNDQPDFIERLYGKIFGKKALEDRNPFGMKRWAF